jgi:hypothetical protein
LDWKQNLDARRQIFGWPLAPHMQSRGDKCFNVGLKGIEFRVNTMMERQDKK